MTTEDRDMKQTLLPVTVSRNYQMIATNFGFKNISKIRLPKMISFLPLVLAN